MLGVYIVYIIVILLLIKAVSKGGKEGYAGCPKKHNVRMKKIFIENYKRELETMSVPTLKRLAIEVGIPKKVYYAEKKSKKNLISIIFKQVRPFEILFIVSSVGSSLSIPKYTSTLSISSTVINGQTGLI